MRPSKKPRPVFNYEAGVYRIKITAFGTTTNGREFILDVPEYTFLVEEEAPIPEQPTMNTENVAVKIALYFMRH